MTTSLYRQLTTNRRITIHFMSTNQVSSAEDVSSSKLYETIVEGQAHMLYAKNEEVFYNKVQVYFNSYN